MNFINIEDRESSIRLIDFFQTQKILNFIFEIKKSSENA